MLPFTLDGEPPYALGSLIFLPGIRKAVASGAETVTAYVLGETPRTMELSLGSLTQAEREILLAGCLMNYYRG